jgi:acetyl esterase/lipase
MRSRIFGCWLTLVFATAVPAQPQVASPSEGLTPTVADFTYGHDSDRQKLDFWQAASDTPTPLVLMIHGGGWVFGDKSIYDATAIEPFLKAGISVARINYRYIQEAMDEKVEPPVKACVLDAARALQTIRSKAQEWNIDPQRIGATGASAGACTSLWLALHNDLAEADSADPIARQSSRLTCAAVVDAQSSLDPKELRQWMPNAIYGGAAFGFAAAGRDRPAEFELLIKHRDRVLPWIKEYSPIELISQDDPPIFLDYPRQTTPPILGQAERDPTHSAIHGLQLADKLQAAGVEAIVSFPGHEDPKYRTVNQFLIDKLNDPKE